MEKDVLYLEEITGVIGQWMSMEFDDEIPEEVFGLLEKTLIIASKKLSKQNESYENSEYKKLRKKV